MLCTDAGPCGGNTLRFYHAGLSSTSSDYNWSNVQANKWYHVAVIYDGSQTKHFIDCVLKANTTGITGNITQNNDDLLIGNNSSGAYPFDGFIDEVRIYPYARTAAQIKADFTARGSVKGVGAQFGAGGLGSGEKLSNGLVGYWKMDESTSNSCSGGTNDSCDSSGNGNDGAWNGDATTAVGKYGNGTTYDGTGDYTDIGS